MDLAMEHALQALALLLGALTLALLGAIWRAQRDHARQCQRDFERLRECVSSPFGSGGGTETAAAAASPPDTTGGDGSDPPAPRRRRRAPAELTKEELRALLTGRRH